MPAYTTLSRLRRGALDDADLKQLNELARRNDVDPDHRITAIFAIANAHDARGEIDTAFAAYRGSAQNGARTRHAREALARPDAGSSRGFRASWSCGSACRRSRRRPMRRVRSSSSACRAPARRSSKLCWVRTRVSSPAAIARRCGGSCAGRPVSTRSSRRRTSSTLQDWAKFYFRDLPENLRGADHITDKHPRNFEAAGLIARMLPNAVIVHVRRNPVETCLSIYRQEFNKNWTFAHRLTDIADYYARYAAAGGALGARAAGTIRDDSI